MTPSFAHRVLAPVRRIRNRLLHVGRRVAHRLGYRCRTADAARLSVILPSYGRPRNIDLILSAVVACDFVSEIIVTNNNPEVSLEQFFHVHDPRIRIIHQPRRTPVSVRFDLSRTAAEPWILAIDDDVFPSARQIRMLFQRLLAAPHAVHGYGGEVWGDPPAKATYRAVRWPRGTFAVDTLMWAFAYTRDHVKTYFDMLDQLGIENADLKSSEDVPLSYAGRGPALIHGVGPMCRCPSDSEPDVATWMRPGFFEHRLDLVARCRAIQAARTSHSPTQARGC
jgi:glycosyltransferase involved in cell wall biosynthesis